MRTFKDCCQGWQRKEHDMYRQGDVLLTPTKSIPKAAKPGKRENGYVILAHGEVTGHAHRIKTRAVRVYEHEGSRWIRVPKTATLTHEEHATIAIAAGDYRVVIQREYSPEEIRNVQD